MTTSWNIIVDFDGTLTETDTELFVASKLLPATDQRLISLFNAYESIEIGLLDYFSAYLELVDIRSEMFFDAVYETPMRHDLIDLVKRLSKDVSVTIVSEGLDVYIHPLLERYGLGDIPLVCNRVINVNGTERIEPARDAEPCDRCLSCKGALVRRLRKQSVGKIAVIGNGASDFCAAREADAVFARDSLERLCTAQGIDHSPWTTASDIAPFFDRKN